MRGKKSVCTAAENSLISFILEIDNDIAVDHVTPYFQGIEDILSVLRHWVPFLDIP